MSVNISNRDDIISVLAEIKQIVGVDSVYSHYTNGHSLPYIAYIGAGQASFSAGDNIFWRSNEYQVELYFAKKDEALEAAIEDQFVAGGWQFSKSDDIFLSDEGIFYITYQLN